MSLRIAVIGDDPLARAGLSALVSGREDLELVGQGAARAFTHLAAAADVVLWDAGSTPLALEADGPPSARILVLVNDDRQAAQALSVGASGVVPRDAAADRLAAALAAVHEGLLVVDEALSDALALRPGPPAPLAEPLTSREREVLVLLSEGLSNKAIAGRLEISESTAKFHVAAILAKLGVASRAEAIVQAARLGLVVL